MVLGARAAVRRARGGISTPRGWRTASPLAAQAGASGAGLASALLALVLLGLGCAYSFTGSNLPGHVKTIAIPNLGNETLEPGLDQEITTAIIDRFIKDGRLKLAPEGKASCRLVGRVLKYENRVNNYGPDETPQDYLVVVTVAITLRDMVKDRELWKDDALTRTAVYAPGASSGLSTEPDARGDVLRAIASETITRTLEPW